MTIVGMFEEADVLLKKNKQIIFLQVKCRKAGKRIKELEFKKVNARKFLTIPITISETSSNPIEDIVSNVLKVVERKS